jgi:hypothetical protein
MPLFSWTLDVAAVNSYAVWLSEVPASMRPGRLSHRDNFQKELVRSLLGLNPGGKNAANLGAAGAKANAKRTAAAAGIGADDVIQTKVPKEFFQHLDVVTTARGQCAWCKKTTGLKTGVVTRCEHPSCCVSLHTKCWYEWHAARFKWQT